MKSIIEDYKDILIAVLIVGIVSMTVVYANFTKKLLITRTIEVPSEKWNIHFENLTKKENNSTNAAKVISPPILSEGRMIIKDLNVEFEKPGDTVSYTFDIVNDGDMDAKLYNYEKSVPMCQYNHIVCSNIRYTLKYTNGNDINKTDVIKAGERVSVILTLELDKSLVDMPNKAVSISNIYAVFDYTQE